MCRTHTNPIGRKSYQEDSLDDMCPCAPSFNTFLDDVRPFVLGIIVSPLFVDSDVLCLYHIWWTLTCVPKFKEILCPSPLMPIV